MKKSFIGFLTAMLIATTVSLPVWAGHGCKQCKWNSKKSEKFLNKKINRMAKHLDLTGDQKSKLEAIFKSKMEKKKALHKETHEEIKSLLNDDQLEKFTKHKGKRCKNKHK